MRFASLLLCAALAPALFGQDGGKRIALVIGNDAYSLSPLKNAVNDAREMQKALKLAGFDVIEVENASRHDMEVKLGEFIEKLGHDDTALFFYAGHGVQIESENFLVPVDFKQAETLVGAKLSSMPVAPIFEELKRKRPKQSIVILDACRSNPVTTKYSLEAGLAKPQDAGKEAFIAFSTGPGQVATDNPDGHNSYFTEALASFVSQPTLTIEINEVFTRVKRQVDVATEGKQTPWVTSSLTSGFYFHKPSNANTENDPTLAEKWLDDARGREQRQDWTAAIDLLNRILSKKPGGALEAAARTRLPYLTARRDAQNRFDAGDYAAAAVQFEEAVKLDSFAADAALQGVNSYLLQDRIPEAIRLLELMRVRGTSEASAKANEMLKALVPVSPEAGGVLKAGVPQPPLIDEIFSGHRFGTPDWDAGNRRRQTAPVDLSRWTKDLKMEVAIPAPIVSVAAPQAATDAPPASREVSAANPGLHVEVVPTAADSRDIRIRRPGEAQQFGYVQFDGASADMPVLYDGRQTPSSDKLRLIPGKYEVRMVNEGKVLSRQEVQVAPLTTTAIPVKLP